MGSGIALLATVPTGLSFGTGTYNVVKLIVPIVLEDSST